MSLTDPPQVDGTTIGRGRAGLVSEWYAGSTQRHVSLPDLDVADVAGVARGGAHTMEDQTAEDVARRVVKRMLDAEQAMLRHLEALEAEAARRTDLLLAQAELDAELIRLNARREAHRIQLAALESAHSEAPRSEAPRSEASALVETGAHAAPSATDQRTLEELTDSLSRFADEVDALTPPEPSHRAGSTV